jgi:3-(3-hydroxy-phenyl)propionate hydroxylase
MAPSAHHESAARKTMHHYAYRRSRDQDGPAPTRHPLVVVGAGPVGLTAGIDLALRGIPVVLLDDADQIGEGSRAICWSKRTLEILDRLGLAERLISQGVTWKLGKIFQGEDLVYSFDLLPEDGHKMPAFINLQQYAVEKALVDRTLAIASIDLRWKNRVVGIERHHDHVLVRIDTPDGPYSIAAEWLIAADGARSGVRDQLGLGFSGVTFEDKFLIADIRMAADFPTERRFWFNPTFHSGQSALMHRQADDTWRVDLQLGPDADVEAERRPERVVPRLRKMLGEREFVLEWVSIYQFNCRRLDRFVRPRHLRRRCRPPGLAVRCARGQFGNPGCGESCLEARRRDQRTGGGRSARQL